MDANKGYEEILSLIEEVKHAITPTEEEKKHLLHSPLTADDLEMLIERTQKMINQLNERADSLCHEMGLSREQLSEYTQDPSHYNAEEWQTVQEMQKQVDLFHKNLMQTLLNQKNEALVSKQREAQKKQKLKGKKNWIPL